MKERSMKHKRSVTKSHGRKRKSTSGHKKRKRRTHKDGTYTSNHKRYKVVGGKRVRVKSKKRQAMARRNPYMIWLKKNRSKIKAAHPNASVVQIARIAGKMYRAQKK